MQLVAPESADKEWFPSTPAEHQKVAVQMEQILASSHFRQSKRSILLLRFIVEQTLKGQESILKERTLGVEVFGRAGDYDTNADPIVRMAAGEVRKRIAQYYHDSGHRDELQIDLQPGSYVARFRVSRQGDEHEASHQNRVVEPTEDIAHPIQVPKDSPFEPTLPTPSSRWRHVALFAGLAGVLLVVSLTWIVMHQRRSLMEPLWGKVLEGSSPRLICLGAPGLDSIASPGESQKPLSVLDHIQKSDFLTFSEVQALVRLLRFLDKDKASYTVQLAASTTFADLRQGPAVLVGGLDNQWTMRAQHSLRFQLTTDNKGFTWILDSRNPNAKKWSVDFAEPYSTLTTDYAIVARFLDPSTQEPTLIVAGLGENGSKAAGEFVTDENELRGLIGDWLPQLDGKNFEVVLETQVINGASGPPRLLAKESWQAGLAVTFGR